MAKASKLPKEWWELHAEWIELDPEEDATVRQQWTKPVYDEKEALRRFVEVKKSNPTYLVLKRCSFTEDEEIVEEYGEEPDEA